mmetsp:Transcript_20461/g.37323  ORF Transcript_20461/g.37323 Transcript_20461/m.37323 type:complete len:406 (-) Transcript_20461:77-1294(-)
MAAIVENRIFVRNVPSAASRDDLATHFGQYGQIVDLYLPLVFGTQQHKGMCFVSYENPESVKVVLAQGVHEVLGEALAVDVCLSKGKGKGSVPIVGPVPADGLQAAAVPGLAMQQAVVQPGPQIKPGRLFLTRVSQNITSEDLTAYFQQFGELEDVYVPPGGKSIAFVSFRDPAIAAAVLQTPTHEVKTGCSVNVDAAIDRPQGFAKGSGGYVAGYVPQPVAYVQPQPVAYVQPQPVAYVQPQIQPQLQLQPQLQPQMQPQLQPAWAGYQQQQPGALVAASLQPTVMAPVAPAAAPHIKPGRLFLTKVPPDVTSEDLTVYFQQYGELEDVYIPPGGKAIAFVSFKDPSTAVAVLQAPVHEIKTGSSVTVDAAIDRPPISAKLAGLGKGYAAAGAPAMAAQRFAPY